jgi:hypothetical protein
VRATKNTDRKPIVLARVRRYLRTGQVGQPTRIPAQIVREESPPARPGPRDRLYYRWYAKEFEGVMRLLRDLTAGVFKDGAVARVLAMDFGCEEKLVRTGWRVQGPPHNWRAQRLGCS